jgi:hypothetical protein
MTWTTPIAHRRLVLANMRAKIAAARLPIRSHNDELLDALKEAVEFQNDDTECLMGRSPEKDEECIDGRCRPHGCMVDRVNRWRKLIAKVEGTS